MKKKETQKLVEIEVLFHQKEFARSTDIEFNRDTRKWYGTDDNIKRFQSVIKEKEEIQNLKTTNIDNPNTASMGLCNTPSEDSNEKAGDTFMFIPYVDPYANETSKTINISKEDDTWDSVLERKNTLEIAYRIQKCGLPETVENRILLLKILGRTVEGQYTITYDGLINASEAFRMKYPEDYVQNLLRSCITGQRHHVDDVRESHLSDEEKQLLYFILPL